MDLFSLEHLKLKRMDGKQVFLRNKLRCFKLFYLHYLAIGILVVCIVNVKLLFSNVNNNVSNNKDG